MARSTIPPIISIIIPVYNGGKEFSDCLESLRQYLPLATDVPTEVIVVADGCTDSSDLLAEKFGADVFRMPTPGGPARARNLGAQRAKGKILFFVDADVAIAADTIHQIVHLFDRHPELTAVIGSYDDAPGPPNFLSQYKNLFHHYTHQTSQVEASTFWGACGVIRRDAFWAVNGFDERYRYPSVEDIELGYRLKDKGATIRLCKSLQVKHLKRWEPLSLLRAEFFYRALPWTELLLSRRQVINDLNLKWSTRISVVLTYAVCGALLFGLQWTIGFAAATLLMVLLFSLNFSVYQFFYRQRGLWFAVRVVPWHWLYFIYSGLAYSAGSVRFYLSKLLPRQRVRMKIS
jgi:glycosyltransferase involved in cell wall biosynthesis